MPTLLVEDDNPSVRQSLRFLFLARGGYEVLTAENGAEALTIAQQQEVHGALVDVNMPGMNGVEVCRTLHELAAGAGRSIAVWLMTGARTAELAKRAEEAGALAVFGKPFDFVELFRHFDEKLMSGGAKSTATAQDGAVSAEPPISS